MGADLTVLKFIFREPKNFEKLSRLQKQFQLCVM
jgi:hypothetical protein